MECSISKTSPLSVSQSQQKKTRAVFVSFGLETGNMDCDRENPSPFSMCPMVTRTAIASTMRTVGDFESY